MQIMSPDSLDPSLNVATRSSMFSLLPFLLVGHVRPLSSPLFRFSLPLSACSPANPPAQISQLYLGNHLVAMWLEGAEWQALALATVFFSLGVGNLVVTARTYIQKSKAHGKQHRRRQSLSKEVDMVPHGPKNAEGGSLHSRKTQQK